MKKTLLILTSYCVLALSASAAETQKTATIDLRKVFDSFWRTKEADARLKADAAELDKDRKTMFDQFQKNEVNYKKLVDAVNDPAISSAEKEKRKKDAENELLGLRDFEAKIKQFDTTSFATLDEKRRRIREKILTEIRDTIKLKVKSAGYTLVLDSAAETPTGMPIILFNAGHDDLTDVVLKELNITAPATPPAKGDGKPEKNQPK